MGEYERSAQGRVAVDVASADQQADSNHAIRDRNMPGAMSGRRGHSTPSRQSMTMLRLRVEHVAIGILVMFAFTSLIGPFLVGRSPSEVDLSATFRPPIWSGGSVAYPFGSDQLGRDELTRIVFGARLSFVIAILAVAAACALGTLIGLLAGYYAAISDVLLSRLMDVQLSLPLIMLGLVLVVVWGPSRPVLIATIAAASWVPYARIVRAEVQVIAASDYVSLARVAGLTGQVILRRHVLPNLVPSLLVLLSLGFGQAILAEASLSFLGLGIQPPDASWGLLISQGRSYLQTAPWLVLEPATAVALVALSGNVVGDYLRDRLDPTLTVVT